MRSQKISDIEWLARGIMVIHLWMEITSFEWSPWMLFIEYITKFVDNMNVGLKHFRVHDSVVYWHRKLQFSFKSRVSMNALHTRTSVIANADLMLDAEHWLLTKIGYCMVFYPHVISLNKENTKMRHLINKKWEAFLLWVNLVLQSSTKSTFSMCLKKSYYMNISICDSHIFSIE